MGFSLGVSGVFLLRQGSLMSINHTKSFPQDRSSFHAQAQVEDVAENLTELVVGGESTVEKVAGEGERPQRWWRC